MKLSYYKKPFPHLRGEGPEELYNHYEKSWDSIQIDQKKGRTNYNIPVDDNYHEITRFMMKAQELFMGELLFCYPKLFGKNYRINAKHLYSTNYASNKKYKIRDWHIDTGEKIIIGLWYFKHPKDHEDCGGNLLLMNPQTSEVDKFDYGRNQLIIFPNLLTSWHSITPRNPSPYPRRFLNLLIDSPDIKFHNYQRIGEKEYRGRLVNYYK
jgi:hypothetical protein